MIKHKRLLSACLVWPFFTPITASALVIEIQGTRLETQIPESSCVEIAGSFPGVRIESSESGKVPRICYNSNKVNSISILNSTFVGTDPLRKDIVVKIEHGFPTGINGKVMARAKIQGFFSMPSGVGVPSGDKISFAAFFAQGSHLDAIAEPFDLTVGDDLESALFDYSVKEQYLMTGPRNLKGVLKFNFTGAGHKLTLHDKTLISIDTGSTMADKLESLGQLPGESEEGATQETPVPSPEGKKPEAPKQPMPFPMPPGGQTAPSP